MLQERRGECDGFGVLGRVLQPDPEPHGAGERRLCVILPGRRNGSEVEVLDGPKPGEGLLLYPTDNVAEGVRVTQR